MKTYKEWTEELIQSFKGNIPEAKRYVTYILEHNDFLNNTAGLKLNQAMLQELNKRWLTMNNLIKSKPEAVNNKYDIRTIYYIDLPEYSQLRFLNEISANIFIAKLQGLKLIK